MSLVIVSMKWLQIKMTTILYRKMIVQVKKVNIKKMSFLMQRRTAIRKILSMLLKTPLPHVVAP